ncbi:hypothetical protein BGZ98_005379 [Dissophora globulifera]|nr:hypothetical protein BGZ98_005379 [Dissophora globulifera]
MSSLSEQQRKVTAIPTYGQYRSLVPPVSSNLHKGQGGRVGIIGGSSECGADLCHIICDEDAATAIKSYSPDLIVHPYIKIRATSETQEKTKSTSMWAQTFDDIGKLLPRIHVLVVGPGLSRDKGMLQSAKHAIEKAKELDIPIVIDADGLFLIQNDPELIHGYAKAVLTPNLVEFKRLCSVKGINADEHDVEEPAVQKLAKAFGGVVIVQKGSLDAISDGTTVYAVTNEGGLKRSGGQGDVLTGLIATSLAWGVGYEKEVWSHSHSVPKEKVAIVACFGACAINRECSRLAFVKHRRAMQASDVLAEIGPFFINFYDKARSNADWSEAIYGTASTTPSSLASENIDTPLPNTQSTEFSNDSSNRASFESQKTRLLTSMDMLYQIQDAPAEKQDITPLDDQEAQYWARRMDLAMQDLDKEQTRLRIAVVGESSGQESIMDLLLPSEENVRRSAKDTGKVHRVRYGARYHVMEDGSENIETAPISWLQGMTEEDGGEIVETPGLDLDDLSMDDIVYNSDLILLRTDAQRQLSLEREQHFLNRYRHKSHIIVVADMSISDLSENLTLSNLKANLAHAVKSTVGGYSNIQGGGDSFVAKVLRISNPEPIPAIVGLVPRVQSESRYLETVGSLQNLVASTLLSEGRQDQHRRTALLTRCRDLMIAGIENMETRLQGRLDTFAQVDRLSEWTTEEIKRIETAEEERIVTQVTDGDIDKDVRHMNRVLDQFFTSEVPFWMLFARSGEIAERMHELWTVGAFAETEHRMAYALGRLHQTSQEAFRTALKAIDTLTVRLEETRPVGSSAALKDLANARRLLAHAQDNTQQEIKDKDAFVVSNVIWKHRNAYGPVVRTLEAGRLGALERLQRRGQITLAQGLGLEGTALFTGVGLAQQYPPEIYLTSGTLLALLGLGYIQVRWKAAENEFRTEADALATQLKKDIVDTYQEQVSKTIVAPLTSVVQRLDKGLGERLLRSLEQRKFLAGIKRDARGEDEIKY